MCKAILWLPQLIYAVPVLKLWENINPPYIDNNEAA